MSKSGISISFNFVPFPQDIWRENIPLTRAEFRLLGYLIFHQVRFRRAVVPLTDDELLHGAWLRDEDTKVRVRRMDKGAGIGGRNNLKKARKSLIERGWIEITEKSETSDMPAHTEYTVVIANEREVSDSDSSNAKQVSDSDTPKIQIGQRRSPKRTREVSDSDTPNKEVRKELEGGRSSASEFPQIEYGKALVIESDIPHTRFDAGLFELAGVSIDILARAERLDVHEAYNRMVERIASARTAGVTVNRFWFSDSKFLQSTAAIPAAKRSLVSSESPDVKLRRELEAQ